MAFFSPMAAFVTGFAQQANENIDRQKLEDRQDDLIWANKFEKGKAEYEKERKSASEKSKLYNTLKSVTQGNEKAADVAFQLIQGNPKRMQEAISWVNENIAAGSQAFQQPEGYQSTSLADIQANLQNRYSNLQELKGSARQGSLFRSGNRFANNMQMPLGPGNTQSTAATPIEINTARPSTADTSVIAPGSQLDIQIGNAKPNGASIALDSSSMGRSPITPQGSEGPPYIVPYRSPETQRQQAQTELGFRADKRAEEELQIKREQAKRDALREPPWAPGAKELEAGLGKKYSTALDVDLTKLASDANNIISYIESGHYQTGGWQAILDSAQSMAAPLGVNLNPFIQAMLPLKANDPQATDLMKKAMTMLQANITSAAGFARVTNFEFMTMGKATPSQTANPQANIYMALTIKKIIERTIDKNKFIMQNSMERYPNGMARMNVYKAEEAAREWDKIHVEETAVPRLNSKTMSPEQYQTEKAKLGQGTYYIDMGTGFMGRVGAGTSPQ